jgi:parallel beta-helix repeat protein
MDFAVQVNGLVKVYDGKVKALDGVDLNVNPGEAFALLGPNGAGKTTLIRILTTQLKPTAGEAYVFGLNVVHDGGKVRKLVSYVPQEMSVWTDISGYENLLIYAKIFGVQHLEREKIIGEVLENTIHGAFVSEDFYPKESVGVDINGSNNSISENLLTCNAHAIVLCGSSNVVSRNKLISNLNGVWLYSSNNNVISENEIKNYTWQVFLIRESYENRIFHNNIFQGQAPQLGIVVAIEYYNIWDDGYPSGGNYWSTYNGTDTNSDGIGDTQYIIDKDNIDRYPLVSPYSQNFITIDKMSPTILILSPEDKEYYEKSIPLIFKISEQFSWIGYSLDRQSNITITGNTTLKELSDGQHNLVVYAKDEYGNIGVSQMIWFSVNSQENIKRFLLATATIAAVIIIIAFVIYKRKSARKHSDGFQSNSSFSHR